MLLLSLLVSTTAPQEKKSLSGRTTAKEGHVIGIVVVAHPTLKVPPVTISFRFASLSLLSLFVVARQNHDGSSRDNDDEAAAGVAGK
jgi:hypothetical protein